MTRLENLLGAHSLAMAGRLLADDPDGPRLPPSEAAALVTLLSHPGQTVAWLGDVVSLTSSGVTRLVERLVRLGWVERAAGEDGRTRTLRLTPAGTERAERVLSERQDALTRAVDVLTEQEQRTLESLLDKLLAHAADDRPSCLRVCRLCDRTACRSQGRDCPLQDAFDEHA
jgi:DNA-binding MarR family transcriptional regulator